MKLTETDLMSLFSARHKIMSQQTHHTSQGVSQQQQSQEQQSHQQHSQQQPSQQQPSQQQPSQQQPLQRQTSQQPTKYLTVFLDVIQNQLWGCETRVIVYDSNKRYPGVVKGMTLYPQKVQQGDSMIIGNMKVVYQKFQNTSKITRSLTYIIHQGPQGNHYLKGLCHLTAVPSSETDTQDRVASHGSIHNPNTTFDPYTVCNAFFFINSDVIVCTYIIHRQNMV